MIDTIISSTSNVHFTFVFVYTDHKFYFHEETDVHFTFVFVHTDHKFYFHGETDVK